jgi:inorganic pyrophosphatase
VSASTAAASSATTRPICAAEDSLAAMLDSTLTDEHPITGELLTFVEIPKGSRNKYEYDEGIGHVVLDRFLSSSMVYPTDYGFLMGHRGRDGDPLDAMVCVSEPTFAGCVIPVKPIALFKMRDEKGEDDKIVCVPTHDPGWNTAETLDDIPKAMQQEISHFFSVYKQLEGKDVEVDGWRSREEALEVIADGRRLQMDHDAPRRS